MSKKQHNKQIARGQQKRRADRFERRSARNRYIIIAMAVLMVLSLFAVPLTQWLSTLGNSAVSDEQRTADQYDGQAAAAQDAAQEQTPEADADDAAEAAGEDDLAIDPASTYSATISTSEGDITVALDAEGAPLATNNLVTLARDGYFEGIIFHRVIDGFMIQGGDPTGTGTGGPGYTFDDELAPAQALVEAEGGYPRGTVAMANSGPDTNGSQFFIVHQDYALSPDYTVFGEVTDGMDVVDAIATSPTGEADRPLDPVEITSVSITEG